MQLIIDILERELCRVNEHILRTQLNSNVYLCDLVGEWSAKERELQQAIAYFKNIESLNSAAVESEKVSLPNTVTQQIKLAISDLQAIRNGHEYFKNIPKSEVIRDINAIIAKLQSLI